MYKFLLIMTILLIPTICFAAPLNWTLQAPPKNTADNQQMYSYMSQLYNRFNSLPVTTTEPNGSLMDTYASEIIYVSGSIYYFCIETTSPSGSTWVGVPFGSV